MSRGLGEENEREKNYQGGGEKHSKKQALLSKNGERKMKTIEIGERLWEMEVWHPASSLSADVVLCCDYRMYRKNSNKRSLC